MDGYFRHPTTREYFQSRIPPPVCFKILSLRGRRLKGKWKGDLGARETRGAREEPKTPFPFPLKRLPRRLLKSRRILSFKWGEPRIPKTLLEILDYRSLWSGLLVRNRRENSFPLLNFFPSHLAFSALFPKDSRFTGCLHLYYQKESFSDCKMYVRKIKPSSWNSKSDPRFWVWKMLLTMPAYKRSISFELLVKVNPAC